MARLAEPALAWLQFAGNGSGFDRWALTAGSEIRIRDAFLTRLESQTHTAHFLTNTPTTTGL
ncbi:hypothetical protein Dda_0588 [Drechslerella dactyloides]|uniref:Uncharacterized protein n=1 Tax=Drechslerella dactyloides TaxID=74499 RepID=A0AAD6NN58_DREDA|nr:hypothetical protein Dda_0588 [Drechslerella dactyloides]